MRLPIEDKKRFIQTTLFWLNIILLALIIRLLFCPHISNDFRFVRSWVKFFINDGYSVFKYDHFYYNVPYPYLLSFAATLFPNTPFITIKSVSIVFDFILAFFVYKCVKVKHCESKTIPAIAALVVLFSPTVILNSAAWGQNDTIYTAFLVACLYNLLIGRQGWAFIAYGLSISFKAHALFLAPFFLWLLTKRKQVNWRYLPLVPLVYLALIVPAWFIGRPLDELLLIYVNQSNRYTKLTLNAPNLYQWIVDSRHEKLYEELYLAGIILSTYVVLALALLVYRSRVQVTATVQVHLAALSVLIMPFILPRMLDRFFIPAEMIAVILAFYLPRVWYIPVLIGLTNFMVHVLHLYQYKPIPLNRLSILILVSIAVLVVKLMRNLEYLRGPPPPSGGPRPQATTLQRPRQ